MPGAFRRGRMIPLVEEVSETMHPERVVSGRSEQKWPRCRESGRR